ncbi:hypothetical protein V5799_032263 [Amblyomma americanum]|uniref:Uncharacterized protein n=1 Tax=Amblyomma americanum TaxID=6943 RepID=A0AAQ4DRP2_AMBAM
MEAPLAERTPKKYACAPGEDNRELILDIVVDSPIYLEENLEFSPRKRDAVKRRAVTRESKRRPNLATCATNTDKRLETGSAMSTAHDHKKRVPAQNAEKSRKEPQIDAKGREDYQAVTAVDTVKSATKKEQARGEDIAAVPEQLIPLGDIFQKIEDLPRPQGEHGAAAPDQRPVPEDTDTEVRYKATGGVTMALLLLALLVLAVVVADLFLSNKDSTDGSTPKTSPKTPLAARFGSENRTARIFVFMSEEESRERDVAILDVNDEI